MSNVEHGQKEYWNSEFSKYEARKPKYDLWLDKYSDILEQSKDTAIIDLECGLGSDSLYLSERGYKVISCDISEVALERVRENVPGAETLVVDMLEGLPFLNSSAKIIIVDLSLHYYFWKDTLRIADEIHRVLISEGHLLCRVNSTKDTYYGAGQGDLVEKNYFSVEGNRKRFFDMEQIEALFDGWEYRYISEYQMDRYKYPKILWEIAVKKKGMGK
jgi:SAM-dependent methyltransferase